MKTAISSKVIDYGKSLGSLAACLLMLTFIFTAHVHAQEDDRRPKPEDEMAKFKILFDRNIFDPARQPEAPERVEGPAPEPRVDRLYLTGVLVSPEERLAFFEGSRDEYFGAIEKGGEIAGFNIAHVDTDRATLEQNDQKLNLPVGTGLTRREGEDWQHGSGLYLSRESPSSSSAEETPTSSFNTKRDGSDSAKLELIKKLKERRMQELKK